MTEPPAPTLAAEAEAFHRAFFHHPPPAEVVERYIAANLHCLGESALDPTSSAVVRRHLDPEAVELVLRLRGTSRLTQKIQILFYLAEVRSENYGFFASQGESLPAALLALIASVLRSAWKFLKGQYLVRRYRLV